MSSGTTTTMPSSPVLHGPSNLPRHTQLQQTGRNEIFQRQVINGVTYTLFVSMIILPNPLHPFVFDTFCILMVMKGDSLPKVLGGVRGHIVDKRYVGRTGKPAWLQLLEDDDDEASFDIMDDSDSKYSQGYNASDASDDCDDSDAPDDSESVSSDDLRDSFGFANLNDFRYRAVLAREVSDLSDALKRLYRKCGKVRAAVRRHRKSLTHDRIHYISIFRINSIFRGQGLAEMGMKGYLRALQGVGDGPAFHGTVILWPSAIGADEAEIEERTGIKCDYHATVQKLVCFYEKPDFEVWTAGSERREGSKTIMGLVLQPQSQ